MDTKKYLDLVGLKHYDSKIKTFIANALTDAEATYTDSLVKKDENGAIINPWQIIDDQTLLKQAPTSKAVLDYVGTFAKSVKETVEGLSVNGETFGTTGEVVLYADDIAMSNTDTTTVKDEIDALKGAVSGGTFFRGVFEKKEDVVNPKNGDVIAIGDKEYIYYEESTEADKWIELGDTTAEGQRIAALETKVGVKKGEDNAEASTGLYAYAEGVAATAESTAKTYTDQEIAKLSNTVDVDATAADLVTDEIAVVTGVNLTQTNGKITAIVVDSAKAATTKYVDDKVSGIATSYVKSFGGKTGDITLSAEGNVTLAMVDNALKASYDDTNVDGISWKETQAITTDEIDALFA